MNRVDVGNLRCTNHRRDVQVAQCQLWRPDADGLIRKTYRQGMPVGLAVNGNRADTQFFTRADDAPRNLSAIRNQNFLKHLDQCGIAALRLRCRQALGCPRRAKPGSSIAPPQTQKGARGARLLPTRFTSLAFLSCTTKTPPPPPPRLVPLPPPLFFFSSPPPPPPPFFFQQFHRLDN